MKNDKKIRIGVIGAGGIAQHAHLPSIQRTPAFELAALSDFFPEVAEKVGHAHGLTRENTYGAHAPILERKDIDVVTICAPTTEHAEIAIAALEAGKHVLVEKPVAESVADAERMAAAAGKTGRILMGAYNHSYDPAVDYIRRMIDNGEIGEIVYAEMFFYEDLYSWTAGALDATIRPAEPRSFWPQYEDPFKRLREYIHNFGSHVLNLTRLLIGEPRGIDYCHWNRRNTLLAVLDYGGFKTYFKNVEVKQHGFEKGLEICGKKKRVRLSLAPPLERYNPGRIEVIDIEAGRTWTPFIGFGWPFEMEYRHLAECIREGREPKTSIRQALADVRLAEELAKAALSKGA